MNYFLGIDGSRRVLVADFEDSATGANHPILGTTAIPTTCGTTPRRATTARHGGCT